MLINVISFVLVILAMYEAVACVHPLLKRLRRQPPRRKHTLPVELHEAFFWCCEDCGADNFARAITLDPDSELIPDVTRFHCEDEHGTWVMKPDDVMCSSCEEVFEVAKDE